MARPRWQLSGWLKALGVDDGSQRPPPIVGTIQPTVEVGRNVAPLVAPTVYIAGVGSIAALENATIALWSASAAMDVDFLATRAAGGNFPLQWSIVAVDAIPAFTAVGTAHRFEVGQEPTTVQATVGRTAIGGFPAARVSHIITNPAGGGWPWQVHIPRGLALVVRNSTANESTDFSAACREYRGVRVTPA